MDLLYCSYGRMLRLVGVSNLIEGQIRRSLIVSLAVISQI
jgi:hypothetical protein